MGIIYNWYIVEKTNEYITYDIEVTENHKNIEYIKEKSIEYIYSLGYFSKEIHLIEESKNIKEIIYIVQSWYYNQFLRYHREQFLNMRDFFEINSLKKVSQNEIVNQLAYYFSGSLLSNGNDEKKKIMAMSIREMIESSGNELDSLFNSKIEGILENEYIEKLDLYISINQIIVSGHLNMSRLSRALGTVNKSIQFDFIDNAYLLYLKLKNNQEKIDFIICLNDIQQYDLIINTLFSRIEPDIIYFAYLLQNINSNLKKLERGTLND
jgi:hypothetical protein